MLAAITGEFRMLAVITGEFRMLAVITGEYSICVGRSITNLINGLCANTE